MLQVFIYNSDMRKPINSQAMEKPDGPQIQVLYSTSQHELPTYYVCVCVCVCVYVCEQYINNSGL